MFLKKKPGKPVKTHVLAMFLKKQLEKTCENTGFDQVSLKMIHKPDSDLFPEKKTLNKYSLGKGRATDSIQICFLKRKL